MKGQARERADGVQVQPIVAPRPGTANLGVTIQQNRSQAAARDGGGDAKSGRAGADDEDVGVTRGDTAPM